MNQKNDRRYAKGEKVYYLGDLHTLMKVVGRRTVNGEDRAELLPDAKGCNRTKLVVLDRDCIPA